VRTLKQDVTNGRDVELWQAFLRGWQSDEGGGCPEDARNLTLRVDGFFGPRTDAVTRAYQKYRGLAVDGQVGPRTWAAAIEDGLELGSEPDDYRDGPSWPLCPDGVLPLSSNAAREAVFGAFRYTPAPVPGNEEAISVDPAWMSEHLVRVEIPQLRGITGPTGGASDGRGRFHRMVARQFKAAFLAIEKRGVRDRLVSWAGSYVARFVRGSRTTLSNHAFGSAIDVNVPWNLRGRVPALYGKKGCVRELAIPAADFGVYWGGWYTHALLDGMHFESYRVMTDDEFVAVCRRYGFTDPEIDGVKATI
jgi:hypothetical protein